MFTYYSFKNYYIFYYKTYFTIKIYEAHTELFVNKTFLLCTNINLSTRLYAITTGKLQYCECLERFKLIYINVQQFNLRIYKRAASLSTVSLNYVYFWFIQKDL